MAERVDSPHRELPPLPDLTPDDIIIAVMGITGCGKSTFVNLLSDRRLKIGHGLDSCTQLVEVAPCTLENGMKIYLVDTPGFDDDTRTDAEILQEVALWLNKAHTENLKLAGIIFLQRISDVRIGHSGIQNITMFRKLCGEDPLASVVLATTMWDITDEDIGITREKELEQKPQLWKRMIDHGSCVFRHNEGKASALKIIDYLVQMKRPVTLDIQREMVDQNLDLIDTSAGSEVASAVKAVIERYERKLEEVEKGLKEAFDQKLRVEREILEAVRKEQQEILAKQREDMQSLHVSHMQLIEEQKRRFEESQISAKEDIATELEKQKKQLKERYLRDMHDRCMVM